MSTQQPDPNRSPDSPLSFPERLWAWFERNILDLGRQMRLSYLPPLMVYLSAGVSGLTGIVGTFFVKEYLGLSAEYLAALGFWAMVPWTLKMPLGHLVDLIWRHKAGMIYFGAGLIAVSLLIMVGLLASPAGMREVMPVETWYVISLLLAPIGYVVQDVVADAMTVEAVPRFDEQGSPLPEEQLKLFHTTMQTLGRVAIIGGTLLVALANVYLFAGVETLSDAQKAAVYLKIYRLALVIPLISVLGVLYAGWLRRRDEYRLAAQGFEFDEIERLLARPVDELPAVNWWILGGGLGFVLFTAAMGLLAVPFNEEIVFAGSLGIVLFLIRRLTGNLDANARNALFGTAVVIFAFRAMPLTGAGSTWWMIDVLGFDQQFLAQLSLLTSALTLLGMFIFRRYMAEHSISDILVFLTVALTILSLPNIAMYYGFHRWTAALTGGVVDARFIALVDTALESPLGQIAMIPMLAWIAHSAPANLKATFFAVMAAFTNLALSLSQLFTKYLNQVFTVTRETRDPSGAVITPADYSELGTLLIAVTLIGLVVPLSAIYVVRRTLLSRSEPFP
ncbi:MAG: major facilitator superfamily permease [Proteobacteria bacterium]|nr:major facilitator superfamily permease [Pseudomonadota bacterium]